MKQRIPHPLLALGCALAGALVLSACNPAGSQPGGMPPPEVTIVAAKTQSLPVEYE